MVHGALLLPASRCTPAPAAAARRPPTMTSSASSADAPSLKRTYTLVAESNPPSPSESSGRSPFKVPALGPPLSPPRSSASSPEERMSLSLKRRYPFSKSRSSPATTDATAVPSLASLFDRDVDMSGCSPNSPPRSTRTFGDPPPPPSFSMVPPPRPTIPPTRPLTAAAVLQSVSTSTSSSSNSSPTTTVSTVDSTTSEDRATPDSSPDSPSPTMALSSTFKTGRGSRNNSRDLTICPPSPGPGYTRPLSPSKRPRNNKNLSLNLPPAPPTPSMSMFGGHPQPIPEGNERSREPTPRSMSAPSSPAFIPPPPPQNPRRRPSNLGLTIKLPGTLPDKTAVRGSLRHHVSSPSMFSPSIRGPLGGMTLPQTANPRQTTFNLSKPPFNPRWQGESIPSSMSSSSVSESPSESSPDDILQEMDEDEEEEPRSGEAKSPAYPAGPVCIFDPNIYLFAEPDAELASQFDVVINVAREVVNPFDKFDAMRVPDTPGIAPDTACTDVSFMTAFEEAMTSPVGKSRPTSLIRPKIRRPEYIHMPWDHNTPILDDLPKLVELISQRSSEGKKILVHCQCGVSRSATLLIAYSMFKNPEKSMQDAYSAVKARSRWIGPNMSLIYQLTDWKKKISNEDSRVVFGGWGRGNMKGGLVKSATTGGLGRGSNAAGNRASDPLPEPQTAPLPGRRNSPSGSPFQPASPMSMSDHPKPQVVRARTVIDDTPSSAPPGMITIPQTSLPRDNRQSWPDPEARFVHPPTELSPPMPASWVTSPKEIEQGMKYAPPPSMAPPNQRYSLEKRVFSPPPSMPGRFTPDIPDAQSPAGAITSPRNSGYFGMAHWGRLWNDPRSPNERGAQSPIIRNIFDVL